MPVNISINTNTIAVQENINYISVNDPNNPNIVDITQPITEVVEIITAGPQGPPGLPGPSGSAGPTVNTGSFVTTSSFNAFTSSYNTGSFTGSFTGSLFGTASFAVSSSRAVSSSFATSASYAPFTIPTLQQVTEAGNSTGEFVNFNNGINVTTAPITATTYGGYAITANSDDTTGFGVGIHAVGAQYGIEASSTNGSGVYASSDTGTGVNAFSTNGTGVNATSTDGVGVYATSTNGFGVYATSTNATGVVGSSDTGNGVYGYSDSGYGVYAVSTNGSGVYAYSNTGKAGVFNIQAANTSNIVEFQKDGTNQAFITHDGTIVSNKSLINTTVDNGVDELQVEGTTNLNGNTKITGSLRVTNGITGSLFGTASFAISSSRAVSSSFATTASFATQALSASFAISSSRAVSSSFATSASFATNALTASYVPTLQQVTEAGNTTNEKIVSFYEGIDPALSLNNVNGNGLSSTVTEGIAIIGSAYSGVGASISSVEGNGANISSYYQTAANIISNDGKGVYAQGGTFGIEAVSTAIDGTAISANGYIGISATGLIGGIYGVGQDVGVSANGLAGIGIQASGALIGIDCFSENGIPGVFYNGAANTSNIVEFKKDNVNQAYITHNGTIVSNKLLVNTTVDNGVDELQVAGTSNLNGNTVITGSLTLSSGSALNISDRFYVNGNKQFNYGQFSSTQTQSGSADTAYSATFDITDFSNGVSLESGSRITVANTGLYNIQFSSQLHTTANEAVDFSIWFAMTGSNIDNSNTDFSIEKLNGGGYQVAALNLLTHIQSGSYVELKYSKTTLKGQLLAQGTRSTPSRPATPSVILTVTQVA
jgi:hypothetical protein